MVIYLYSTIQIIKTKRKKQDQLGTYDWQVDKEQ